jgi:competence protein ComEC
LVAINPKLLLFDVGFQLSFLAFAGLVYLSPVISRYFRFFPDILRQVLVATISAQIFALPILLYNFDSLSLISVFANILALPIVPFTMLAGFITGIAGFVWPALSSILAWPAWILLSYIILVVQKLSGIPFASLHVSLNLVGVFAYYIALASFLWFIHLRQTALYKV